MNTLQSPSTISIIIVLVIFINIQLLFAIKDEQQQQQQPRTESANDFGLNASSLALSNHDINNNVLHNITKRSSNDQQENVKLICYYSNWAIYRPGVARFTPQNINPFLCTHLIYAFAGLSSKYELKAFDPYNDINQGNYKKFVGLKKYNNQLKTMIAIGGWNEGSKRFSKLVANNDLRSNFIKSVLKFLREHNFDGIDFDWEYPAFREGSAPEDKEGYAKLIRELRFAFNNEKLSTGKERLLLSVAVPAGQDYIDQGFDVPVISQYADFLNVLSYDYHTSFDPETDHHAPLKSKPDFIDEEASKLNAEWTINYYIRLGAPREKLILGIPTYGRSFTLADESNNGINALAEGPGEPGPSTREKGYLAFYEICQKVEDDDWQLHRPYPHIEGPYAVKGKQWVAFDDIEIIQDKAKFIIDQRLGGAMVWTLDNDDFRGNCYGEQNPLISSLRSSLINPLLQVSPAASRDSTSSTRPLSSTRDDNLTRNRSRPPNFGLSEAGLNALNVNTRRNQRRKQYYGTSSTSTTTTTTTTTTTQAPTTTALALSYTTPEPPTTPDPGIEFHCEDEGFFTNPKDCRKYFWCLDSGPANLGIVAHSFTCPSGLYFNSKTEACDYQENVSCRNKKDKSSTTTKRPRIRPKIATTSSPITTTTTTTTTTLPPPTTTTQQPITSLSYRQDNDEKMMMDTMRKFNDAAKNGNHDELIQLANLIKALGGIEKLEAILKGSNTGSNDKRKPLNSEQDDESPSNFFAYVTPKRTQELMTTTQAPSRNDRSKPIRQRRPQFFDSETILTTTTVSTTPAPQTTASLFSYYEKPKSNNNRNNNNLEAESIDNFVKKSNAKPFEFNYNQPEGRNTMMNAFNDMQNSRRLISEENKQTFSNESSSSAVIIDPNTRQIYRIPYKLNNLDNNRASDIIDNNLIARQKDPSMTRRIRLPHPNTMHQFSPAVLIPDKAGVVYEDEFLFDYQSSSANRMSGPSSQTHPEQFLPPGSELPLSAYLRQFQPPPPPYQLPNNDIGHRSQSSSSSTSSSQSQHPHQRRKPQNHFNIPLQQENPINLLINTPPRSPEDNKLPFNVLNTTPSPLTTTSSTVPKFTNYNTLPPEFDISPFTSTSSLYNPIQANNFQKNRLSDLLDSLTSTLSSSNPTTPMPTTLITNNDPIIHSMGPRRRIARPRRPLPGIQHHHQSPTTSLQTTTPKTSTTTTTTTTTTRRPYIAPAIDTFNGPSVFSNTDNSLGCSKRGVFAHPESCGMFVVCAPAGRNKKGFRTLTHHCPAEQVFVEEVGRCRPGNKDRCEVYH
ncbi:uncharacterized protein LOC113794366 isoform X2 [Dermatophagoides pteronyssinus]|uniref:uncharacterized protein LOC113794366 isoform X2 n=1 Tax=Dermatophagoides pteronyssinus TaxID=6956 RepID=UPI003F674125